MQGKLEDSVCTIWDAQPIPSQSMQDDEEDDEIGELTLVFNEKMEFIDENWILDVDSPFIIAKQGNHSPSHWQNA